MKKKAFTLVELLITLIIMGVLSTLVVPSFFEYQRAKNLDLSMQLIETSLSQGFSSSRSNPRIFGLEAQEGSSEIALFECEFPTCTNKKTEQMPITPDVKILHGFGISFLPPHGDIATESFENDFLDIELQNSRQESRIIRVYKKSGLVQQVLP